MGDEPMSKPTGRKVRPHIQGENRLSSWSVVGMRVHWKVPQKINRFAGFNLQSKGENVW